MATTIPSISSMITTRRSGRAYDVDIEIDAAQIRMLCEAAHWAPSCYGDEPWRFIVWNKHKDAVAWQRALDCLAPGNQEWAKNAPILILSASSPNFNHNNKPNRWNGYDTGAASLNLCLQATHLGLMSHQMGGFDTDKLKQAFQIPEEIECWAMIAVGAPADIDSLSPELKQREQKARSRQPLINNFYYSSWKA